jgi:bifunctional non-homologous end joining protein LigD
MAFFAGTGQPKHSLVAQIEFTEWTPDGHLRHSKFVGLREDKAAQRRLKRATEVEGRGDR